MVFRYLDQQLYHHQYYMSKFELIATVENLRELYTNVSFLYECITKQCDIGRDVWIQYYKNKNQVEGKFKLSDYQNLLDGDPVIVLYVKDRDNTYDVYRYSGELIIDRLIFNNISHDILENKDNIIDDLKAFLGQESNE